MFRKLLTFLREDEAATAVEYAVMLGLILLAAFGGITALGLQNGSSWNNIDSELQAAGFGS